ncbi:bifunctional proline dehydrogenase/L-glutamate gamma-semialdehyde dehydrogenase PutA [Roseospirillum parvum]|uniref:Bifunctional protein PutA n=1 Tax=Roseospirillum parvum TaxID=83401 RepID=A0A1G8DUZ1_9PROT|nr:bifunctional proline dehydrogenase/L-glutamate gamma-semialdehyde dehydrogenase PutA [Roseospirillum parvum]SDH61270.1 RHH-type transcriptional regulator, proline utilization regulon repressor / proline dehydrogenase / delta 1-pyrroline-5-carboxylate dehydrogenase [Roseospirillum parvum]
MTDHLNRLRTRIRDFHLKDEAAVLAELSRTAPLDADLRARAQVRGQALVEALRADRKPALMDVFLAEYGLSTDEGVALMCLAEALLRVPDAETIDALIEDKIAPSAWGAHLGQSSSSLVNASTWALMLTGRVLSEGTGVAEVLRGAVRRLGEPVIRAAAKRAMKEMGNQFVLGESIAAAVTRAGEYEAEGYTYSYDMLGEAAITADQAAAYRAAYAAAIAHLAPLCRADDPRDNPGISVKLSALFPRFEATQHDRLMAELVPALGTLARAARAANMGLTVDAEEADRLEPTLDVIEAVLADPELAGWDGFGVVVQAYGRRVGPLIDWLHALAETLDRRLMVRLVKGAYWDSEIKRAQVAGLPDFPVFTRKAASDVAYLASARRLLALSGRLYPQFASHNAHTLAAVLEVAEDLGANRDSFEFQRLHGMGESLHANVKAEAGTRCRIYAPVGAHRDLLAYLVRRLLENGANSSFVNQLLDAQVPAATVAADPFAAEDLGRPNPAVRPPPDLFAPERRNSAGTDLTDPPTRAAFEAARAPFRETTWEARPTRRNGSGNGPAQPVSNPFAPAERVGQVHPATPSEVAAALNAARPWTASAAERAAVLVEASELYEAEQGELCALLTREAGKTPADAIADLREAVDFLRYYAARAGDLSAPARGLFACISPWNFPLAIFTGQIAAALAAGNGVLAKPAEATPLIAARATALLHRAGVPAHALALLPGEGPEVGAALVADPRIGGVAFTGSTATAHRIHRTMAEHLAPDAPLIAETGGLNAMIVDSTALPEQAIGDIIVSAFQSAGQRCSALRMLYLQADIAEPFLDMLYGAMDQLALGDPWDVATDIGPVIDARARVDIEAHVERARAEGRLLKQLPTPRGDGHFVGPAVIRLEGIEELEREVFGPVLHVATFQASRIDRVVDAINAQGYGLTFGVHSRIDDRVERITARVRAGNLYVNRNQIGAIVGSQPFGGQGLSGTGPKAGGPDYLARFTQPARETRPEPPDTAPADPAAVQACLDKAREQVTAGPLSSRDLPGPTGESNRYSHHPRGVILCLGPDAASAEAQATQARAAGCAAVCVAPGARGENAVAGRLEAEALRHLDGFDAVACWGPTDRARALRQALAARPGAILPLLSERQITARCRLERHLCIDTTASGGNAQLLAAVT